MSRGSWAGAGFAALLAGGACAQGQDAAAPKPVVVSPGATPAAPPSDAIVLFDGKDLSQWKNGEKWEIKDGYAIVKGSGQGRGNSGVFLANRYEVQVLDSYDNKTYFDGQCASLYKQTPPMVNACRKPGEWQSYDIIFTAPRFDQEAKEVKVLKPGYVTVIHNGVVVQNHFELLGNTNYDKPAAYEKHPVKQPIRLQNHGNPVKFRNIWLREIKALEGKKPEPKPE